MKNKVLLFFICLSSLNTFSQNLLPVGATWYTGIVESFFSPNQGFIISSVIGDSIILSKSTSLIESHHYNSNNQLISIDSIWMYEDSGKVYNLTNGQFYKLYDFNLLAGDSWQISVPYPSPYIAMSLTSPDTIVQIKVDSISTKIINGQSKRIQYVHSINNDWYFLNPIIEGIGSSGGLFPFCYDWQDYDIPLLRCYSDSLIFYQNTLNLPCDTIINNINVNEKSIIDFFPNPTNSLLNIIDLLEYSQLNITIFDSQGRMCIQRKTQNGEDKIILDFSGLSSGCYYCLFYNDEFNKIDKIIKY